MATTEHGLWRQATIAVFCGCLGAAAGAVQNAAAAGTLDIGTVEAETAGSGSGSDAATINSAPYQAPSKAPLTVTQPTSVLTQHYIEHNVVPSANYDEVIKNTPSVSSIAPNGPGLMENMGLSIRGFQDGQYNVTFDGIPWGDSNDFTHHTTSYFMSHDLGQAQVDRGPGTAATLGDATFGGTVALTSKDPEAGFTVNPYFTGGSFGTTLFGGEVDSGSLNALNGTSAFIDAEHLNSDGYLTYSGQRRTNVFAKVVAPIGQNTVMTLVAMDNKIHQNVPIGATAAQIAAFGPDYALNNDPTSQAYYGYNYDNIRTDFEYIGLKSDLGSGFRVDNKLYTYGYYHHGQNGADVNGETPNGTAFGANNVPGQKMKMDYRSFGDIFRLAKDIRYGTFNTGIWVDHQNNSREQIEVDWTLGGIQNTAGGNPIDRLMHDSLDTVQPYAEFDWKATSALTVSPGLKYAYFQRHLNALVNQKTGKPLNYTKSYEAPLPSLAVHYKIKPHWTAYAQVARGFLAPNLNTFYTADPSASSVSPEKTWNYQIGTAWQTHRLALGADVYYIDFSNKIGSRKVGTNTIFFNEGGVVYKGVEAEATYYVGAGFSLYANGSFNSAKDKSTHQWIANAPRETAALGLIYGQDGWYGSAINKYVSKTYGDTGQTQPIGAYSVTDLALGYSLKKSPVLSNVLRGADFKLQVNNIFDTHKIDALAGYTGQNNTPLYWTIPGRSVFGSVSVKF